MAVFPMVKGAPSGGGGLKLVSATSYGTKSVTFNWDYDAVAYIVIWVLNNQYQQFAYGEIGSDNVLFANPNASNHFFIDSNVPTWTSGGMTATATARSLTVAHETLNFSSAYIIPLREKVEQ